MATIESYLQRSGRCHRFFICCLINKTIFRSKSLSCQVAIGVRYQDKCWKLPHWQVNRIHVWWTYVIKLYLVDEATMERNKRILYFWNAPTLIDIFGTVVNTTFSIGIALTTLKVTHTKHNAATQISVILNFSDNAGKPHLVMRKSKAGYKRTQIPCTHTSGNRIHCHWCPEQCRKLQSTVPHALHCYLANTMTPLSSCQYLFLDVIRVKSSKLTIYYRKALTVAFRRPLISFRWLAGEMRSIDPRYFSDSRLLLLVCLVWLDSVYN